MFYEKMLTVLWFSNGFGSGRLLGLSWDLLGPSCGSLLVHLVGLLVPLRASVGASWGLLGLLGRRVVPLGASLGPRSWLLDVSKRSLASLWESLVPLGNLLACFLLRGKLLRANYKGGKGLSCCRVGPDDLSSNFSSHHIVYSTVHIVNFCSHSGKSTFTACPAPIVSRRLCPSGR